MVLLFSIQVEVLALGDTDHEFVSHNINSGRTSGKGISLIEMGRGLYGYVGGAYTTAFEILEQHKTMARYYSLFVLLIMVSGVVCSSHSSPQPRGPDSTGETSTPQLQNDQTEDTAGECPADDEQVTLLIICTFP